jgi:hypothetical protein
MASGVESVAMAPARPVKTSIQLSPFCSIREHLAGGDLVALNVGPDGVVYLVVAQKPLDYRTTAGGATFAKTSPDAPQTYRVVGLLGNAVVLETLIEQEALNIHDVQPLGDELLLVCSRSMYRSAGDIDHNGRVYSRTGVLKRELVLGDGIESTQVTSRGEVWTSFFDEGVFGNYGWTDPIGASGLVAWDATGQKLYEFEAESNAGDISDCYALNVASDDDVWCYYYTDFPLVHLHKHRIASTWSLPVHGSHAFAVCGDCALFAGAYREREAFKLVRLQECGRASEVKTFGVVNVAGETIRPERTVGRGEYLYALSEGQLYRLGVRDVLVQLRA